jgi:exopolyphosphatase/guanosine-5'-triphosphate,3'-diphosphate pyrophosphatase
VVAEATMRHLGLRRLEICPWALREGIAIRRLEQLSGLSRQHDDIAHLLRPLPEGRTHLQAVGGAC